MKTSSSGPLNLLSLYSVECRKKKSRFSPSFFVRNSGKGGTPEEDGARIAFRKAIDYKKKNDVAAGAGGMASSSGGISSASSSSSSSSSSKEGLSMPEDEFREEEAEIIVGDATKFGSPPPAIDENPSLYKPKVSTWGVFPRPSNISKTYGGGRNIAPGELLETKEQRAAKDALTRKLLSSYRSKMGLNIDKNLRSECHQALKDGDALMDAGKLKEALGFYQQVMEKLPFQSELHGMAALQWSICQDSLSRADEARNMYEKLQSHPNPAVTKQARRFFFGFRAMDIMKVTTSSAAANVGYQNYFDAFVEGNKTELRRRNSNGEEEEETAAESSYIVSFFLVSPLLLLVILVLLSGR